MDTDAGAFYGALSSRFSLDASEVILLEAVFKRLGKKFQLIDNAENGFGVVWRQGGNHAVMLVGPGCLHDMSLAS